MMKRIIRRYNLILAHQFSNNHKPELEKDHKCGCFYCLEIFDPAEIEEWLIHDNPCDRRGTAICPYCDIDSVIGESSGFPITKEFLEAMNKVWFGDSKKRYFYEKSSRMKTLREKKKGKAE